MMHEFIEKINSFRRIFYRVPGSLRVLSGDWDVSGNANAFYGVTNVSESSTLSSCSNVGVKEIEEGMSYVMMNIALYIIEVSDIFLNLNVSEMVEEAELVG